MARCKSNISLADRFWMKVDKGASDDCWLWIGAGHGKSYGGFSYKGRSVPAQRISWLLAHGAEPPEHLFVCHKCDVPKCVNPAHLFLGDHQANMDDMVQKGRSTRIHPRIEPASCDPPKPHIAATLDDWGVFGVRPNYVYDFEDKGNGDKITIGKIRLPQKI